MLEQDAKDMYICTYVDSSKISAQTAAWVQRGYTRSWRKACKSLKPMGQILKFVHTLRKTTFSTKVLV